MTEVEPLRSLLFVPGHRTDWVDSVGRLGCDGVVFDLADSVPESAIDTARSAVHRALEDRDPTGPRLLVRVSPPGTEALRQDLDKVVIEGIGGIMIPHVSSAEDVRGVADLLDGIEVRRGLSPESTAIMPLVENAKAARFCYEIATASSRVAYMGGATARDADISRSMGFNWTPEGMETLFLRSWVLMNVRAADVPFPITGMWSVIDDLDGLRSFAEQSRNLGYCGMMIIHPSHISVVNNVFTPTQSDIDYWQGIVRSMEVAEKEGLGAIQFEGQMIDKAHVKTAELGLSFVRRLGLGTDRPKE